ncbi:26S proteasome non-ATPase regulatory subunit 13-like [Oscarella lobularis]|uniref:26S proteasome non-ATPase regulatory subunit 13-like n=1 Tax=Oscarella lobularis TaxID=121494 RepID=UPI003313E7CC
MSTKVNEYLAERQRSAASPEIAHQWVELEDLYTKKLWHQLTLKLKDFIQDGGCSGPNELFEMYERFLSDFEHRINPLSLVEIVLRVVGDIKDPSKAIEFLEGIGAKVKGSLEAAILCETEIGTTKLECGDLVAVKALIRSTGDRLETVDTVSFIHARFYNLSSRYYMLTSAHAEYYRDALRYLGCIEMDDIPVEERRDRAFKLSIAAILGDGVYNFGELLAHPILSSLQETEHQWLVDLLYAFNSGSLPKFYELRPRWESQHDLVQSEAKLLEKIRLLCIMELTFTRPSTNRSIPFQVIADASQISLKQVEFLVMKALSLGLVKGTIDEVKQLVNMTWVQPRVLDLSQIQGMCQRLDEWSKNVKQTIHMIEDHSPELLA